MPTSSPAPLTHICTRLLQLRGRIRTLLDIGVGNGKYGFLAREYLDVWGGRFRDNKFIRRAQIDGIEAFPQYVNSVVEAVYDHVFVGDALQVLPTLPPYDMILCCDVLEHFVKEDGRRLLELCRLRSRVKAILTTPVVVFPKNRPSQGATHGNEFERHRAEWSNVELAQWGRVFPMGRGIHLLEINGTGAR